MANERTTMVDFSWTSIYAFIRPSNSFKEIEPLLIQYGMDLAVWRHMHGYERTTPVKYNNFTDKDHFSTDGKLFISNKTHLEFK